MCSIYSRVQELIPSLFQLQCFYATKLTIVVIVEPEHVHLLLHVLLTPGAVEGHVVAVVGQQAVSVIAATETRNQEYVRIGTTAFYFQKSGPPKAKDYFLPYSLGKQIVLETKFRLLTRNSSRESMSAGLSPPRRSGAGDCRTRAGSSNHSRTDTRPCSRNAGKGWRLIKIIQIYDNFNG